MQQNQPPGVPPLALTGERTLPDVPEENYWFRRHLAVYEWIAERVRGRNAQVDVDAIGVRRAEVERHGPRGQVAGSWCRPAVRRGIHPVRDE